MDRVDRNGLYYTKFFKFEMKAAARVSPLPRTAWGSADAADVFGPALREKTEVESGVHAEHCLRQAQRSGSPFDGKTWRRTNAASNPSKSMTNTSLVFILQY